MIWRVMIKKMKMEMELESPWLRDEFTYINLGLVAKIKFENSTIQFLNSNGVKIHESKNHMQEFDLLWEEMRVAYE